MAGSVIKKHPITCVHRGMKGESSYLLSLAALRFFIPHHLVTERCSSVVSVGYTWNTSLSPSVHTLTAVNFNKPCHYLGKLLYMGINTCDLRGRDRLQRTVYWITSASVFLILGRRNSNKHAPCEFYWNPKLTIRRCSHFIHSEHLLLKE